MSKWVYGCAKRGRRDAERKEGKTVETWKRREQIIGTEMKSGNGLRGGLEGPQGGLEREKRIRDQRGLQVCFILCIVIHAPPLSSDNQ